jgi:hypothetical protein
MGNYKHSFVEEYDGFEGFGFSREVDEATLTCYLQRLSDDKVMELLRSRMTEEDMEALFDYITRIMKQYLKDKEYHKYFLKDEEG